MKLFDENGRHVGDLHDGDNNGLGIIGIIILVVAFLPNAFICKYLGMTAYIVGLCILAIFATFLYFKFTYSSISEQVDGKFIGWVVMILLFPIVLFLLFFFQDFVTSLVAGTALFVNQY